MELQHVKSWEDLEGNQWKAVTQKLGGIDRIKMLLRDHLIITEKVMTKGWILALVKKGIRVDSVDTVISNTTFAKDESGPLERRIGFRQSDLHLSRWRIPATEAGSAICYELTEAGATFQEMAASVLGDKMPTGPESLAKRLIKSGKTFSLKQVEDLWRRFVYGGKEVCLSTYQNFFFVHLEGEEVRVLALSYAFYGWDPRLYDLTDERVWSRSPKEDGSCRQLYTRN